MHGELFKVRSTYDEFDVHEWKKDLVLGDLCAKGYQMRPDIVWFGEAVPLIPKAISICETADIVLIIGTSLQVYPAASLMHYAPADIPIYYIDPNPAETNSAAIEVIKASATEGMQILMKKLVHEAT